MAPTWANPFAPPPDKANPTLVCAVKLKVVTTSASDVMTQRKKTDCLGFTNVLRGMVKTLILSETLIPEICLLSFAS